MEGDRTNRTMRADQIAWRVLGGLSRAIRERKSSGSPHSEAPAAELTDERSGIEFPAPAVAAKD
jgi:hypothetical protein